jgi:hypothetical protein
MVRVAVVRVAGSVHPAVMRTPMAVMAMAVMVAVVRLPLVPAVPLSTAVITHAFAVSLAFAPLTVLALGSFVVTAFPTALAVAVLFFPFAILREQSHNAHPGLDGGLEIAALPFSGGHRGRGDDGGREGGEAAGSSRDAGHGEHGKTPRMSGDVEAW